MEFSLLVDEPHASEIVAQWYYEQWCDGGSVMSLPQMLVKLKIANIVHNYRSRYLPNKMVFIAE